MQILEESRLELVTAGIMQNTFGLGPNLPYQGKRTIADGFWNGLSTIPASFGYSLGLFIGALALPFHILNIVDLSLPEKPSLQKDEDAD